MKAPFAGVGGQTQPSAPDSWFLEFDSQAKVEAFAAQVAEWLKADDLVTLSGDLGSGKTTFARALLRELCADPELEVPSPTFTLMQTYQGRHFPIVHADLYRIKSPDELAEIGWDEAAENALVLVEWADRAGEHISADRLDINFYMDVDRGPEFRQMILRGHGRFVSRLQLERAKDNAIVASGFANARREFMQGDASTRLYERLKGPDGRQAVLMLMPPRAHGPIIRFGKTYGEIARLAQDIRAFAAMDTGLRGLNLSAPVMYSMDMAAGVAVLEDFGSEPVADANGPIIERYSEAVKVLARLHNSNLPTELPLPDGSNYTIPPYDFQAMLIELDLILDWYAPHICKILLPASARSTFSNLWRKALNELSTMPTTWTLRDYHSPNLIWLKERQDMARIGLIDFQDCVLGHPAYDVASLLQDSRIDVSDADEIRLLTQYARLRQMGHEFDMLGFARAYALLGAQRNTKILGIFARLDKRDHKPQYLAHIPRIIRYLVKDLAHPVLSEVRAWYETHLPHLFESQS